ncbi:SIP domain-containing protein, partial [Microbacterium lacticum]|uniref:SIP domain-containing protein n=1 Tax=Microbacterium lacticum TaxID=33885 RepID=UPI001F5A34A1
MGPGGGYSPNPTADAHLFAGDLSAVPAISAGLERLEALNPDARGHVVIEVDSETAIVPVR